MAKKEVKKAEPKKVEAKVEVKKANVQDFDFKDNELVEIVAVGSKHLKKGSVHIVGGALAKVLIKQGKAYLKK